MGEDECDTLVSFSVVSAPSACSTEVADLYSYLERLKSFSEWHESAKVFQRALANEELRRQAAAVRAEADEMSSKLLRARALRARAAGLDSDAWSSASTGGSSAPAALDAEGARAAPQLAGGRHAGPASLEACSASAAEEALAAGPGAERRLCSSALAEPASRQELQGRRLCLGLEAARQRLAQAGPGGQGRGGGGAPQRRSSQPGPFREGCAAPGAEACAALGGRWICCPEAELGPRARSPRALSDKAAALRQGPRLPEVLGADRPSGEDLRRRRLHLHLDVSGEAAALQLDAASEAAVRRAASLAPALAALPTPSKQPEALQEQLGARSRLPSRLVLAGLALVGVAGALLPVLAFGAWFPV